MKWNKFYTKIFCRDEGEIGLQGQVRDYEATKSGIINLEEKNVWSGDKWNFKIVRENYFLAAGAAFFAGAFLVACFAFFVTPPFFGETFGFLAGAFLGLAGEAFFAGVFGGAASMIAKRSVPVKNGCEDFLFKFAFIPNTNGL